MNEIYKLKLGERYHPNNNEVYTRVPGGWVYGDMQGTCFIPFNNEFQNISDNSDYAVPASPSPKLPSLDDVWQGIDDGSVGFDYVKNVYETVKKLGNFA